jgi:hypothetical protein
MIERWLVQQLAGSGSEWTEDFDTGTGKPSALEVRAAVGLILPAHVMPGRAGP